MFITTRIIIVLWQVNDCTRLRFNSWWSFFEWPALHRKQKEAGKSEFSMTRVLFTFKKISAQRDPCTNITLNDSYLNVQTSIDQSVNPKPAHGPKLCFCLYTALCTKRGCSLRFNSPCVSTVCWNSTESVQNLTVITPLLMLFEWLTTANVKLIKLWVL